MAIISASRKTDIPTYFSKWFLNCLEKQEFYIRNNPYNKNAVTHITFNKEDIDCIVFWTKNPMPMFNELDRLNNMGYPYYFQFTLTGYGEELEGNIPEKSVLIDAFQKLSNLTNKKVIWRYDPIIIDFSHNMDWHLGEFTNIASNLDGYTNRCVISFVDLYKHLNNYKDINTIIDDYESKQNFINFCKELVRIAHLHNMEIFTCAEELVDIGIERGACIDKDYIEKIVGYELSVNKDKGQRSACLCAESIDIGKYDTCNNRCKYCYACKDRDNIIKNFSLYDPNSLFLCDKLNELDVITEKKLQSLRKYNSEQLTLF